LFTFIHDHHPSPQQETCTMKLKLSLIAAAMALTAGAATAQTQGVSKTEITLGSIQDLSGPLAGFGKQVRLGMMLRVDEANEQGGINGRKFKLLVEDSAYDPRRAVLAAQKLVNQDKIFAMIGHIGTAQNMAAMPVQFQKNVMNFFPVTAARGDVRALPQAQVFVCCDLLRPDAFGCADPGERKECQANLCHAPGR
jgi:ABC-type branched-subunit amino acid transport system substrate-binding protein